MFNVFEVNLIEGGEVLLFDVRRLVIILVLTVAGCEGTSQPDFRFNAVEWMKQERQNLDDGEHFDEAYREEIGNLMTAVFGKPHDPRFPFLYEEDDPSADVLTLENIQLAAGPVKSDRQGRPAGLYREHCVQCHGITGDGQGPTAAFLNPYPRDFRLGKFKFKSTPLRRAATNEDLTHVIRNGIPGTAMPAFQTLSPSDVEALVDYVKYLSIRGQWERKLLGEIDSLDGDPLLDFSLLDEEDGDLEQFEEQLFAVIEEYLVEDLVERWANADRAITEVPVPPVSFTAEHKEHKALIENGKLLFQGKANCIQCHGPTGLGDGQNENYDDWTNDWLKTAGVDPNKRETYKHFLDAGAFRPRFISPRNLQLAVFRGGSRPQDIYRRIANGIEGTPMPSAPTLSPEEIWALVAFVRNMPKDSPVSTVRSKSVSATSQN